MRLSKLISIILHPVFIPFLTIFLVLNISPELKNQIPNVNSLLYIYVITIISSFIIPLFFVFLLAKKGFITSLELNLKKERLLPLLFSAASMSIGFLCIEYFLIFPSFLKAMFLAAIIIVFLAVIISFFWKISLHMLSIGGVLGVILAFNFTYAKAPLAILFSFCICVLLGFARIKEKAHTKAQVLFGFLIGLLIEFYFIKAYLINTSII